MPLFYKGQDVGCRRVDFLVNKEISVEIKAIINKINDREMFMKGIDYSYYYEE